MILFLKSEWVTSLVQVLGALGHPKMQPTYMPNVEAAFPEKNRLRVSVRASSPPPTILSMYLFIMKPVSMHAYKPHHLHAFAAIKVDN